MKTQIIALESHDDLISVRDRMSWAKSPRILIVWPKYEKVMLRSIDLRVLQQHALSLGADLGLVTRRAGVRRDAQGFGIPVFDSTAAAQRDAWPTHRSRGRPAPRKNSPDLLRLKNESRVQEAQWRSGSLVRVGFFALGVLAVVTVGSLFIPRATIKLSPITRQQDMTLHVTASPSVASASLSGLVPSHKLNVAVTGTQSAEITSQASIPQAKAAGIARFKNLTQSVVPIPAGTIIYSIGQGSVHFATMNDTHLPGTNNAFVDVPITAVAAGGVGNLPANSIQAIDGNLGLSASVNNPAPTAGGSDLTTIAPSENDRRRVHDVLLGILQQEAQRQLTGLLNPKDLLLINTLKIGQVLQETYDPAAGAAGSLLTLTMRINMGAQYVAGADVTQMTETVLNASVPDGFLPSSNSLSYQIVGTPTFDQAGSSIFDLHVDRTLLHSVNAAQANLLVRGLTPKAAIQMLEIRMALAKAPEIELTPSWWYWLPLIPFRITVQ
jgi:Baseplate J-like protein